MWELLKKIAKAGWKPYGKDIDELTEEEKNIRLITSRNSGLWQFVCKNGMVKMKEGYYWQNIVLIHSEEYDYCDYQYWIIESALKDESELEDFLLQNIRIGNED